LWVRYLISTAQRGSGPSAARFLQQPFQQIRTINQAPRN
jgi:hypothetical protein